MDTSTDSRMKATREWLLARGAELRERVRRVHEDIGRVKEPLPRGSTDAAILTESDEILQAIENSALAELTHIEGALERMEIGLFALCEYCGEEIDAERLRVVPYATACCGCAKEP